jgi:hypothetical protein
LPKEERDLPMAEKLRLLRAGLMPLHHLLRHDGALFINGWTSLVESSAIGAMPPSWRSRQRAG